MQFWSCDAIEVCQNFKEGVQSSEKEIVFHACFSVILHSNVVRMQRIGRIRAASTDIESGCNGYSEARDEGAVG